MKKTKLIYDVREAVRAYSNDAKITNAYILHLIDTVRAKYIRQQQRKNPGESKLGFTQTLLMATELVDRSYLPSITVGTTILRTVKALPTLIGKTFLKDVVVRPVDKISVEIEYMDKVRATIASIPNFIFAYLDDDMHMYFVQKHDSVHKYLQNVAISAILETPEDIVSINNLDTDLVEYPLTEAMWTLMKPELLDYTYKIMQIPIDQVDDNQTQQ